MAATAIPAPNMAGTAKNDYHHKAEQRKISCVNNLQFNVYFDQNNSMFVHICFYSDGQAEYLSH